MIISQLQHGHNKIMIKIIIKIYNNNNNKVRGVINVLQIFWEDQIR